MKKPYISSYEEISRLKRCNLELNTSYLTKSIEDSDPDDIRMASSSSRLTETIEDSDPDD